MTKAQKAFLMSAAAVAVGIVLLNNVRAVAGNTVVGKVISGGFLARNG